MYLDTASPPNVTVGIGHRIATVGDAQSLPFVLRGTTTRAKPDAVADDFKAVKARPELAKNGAKAFRRLITVEHRSWVHAALESGRSAADTPLVARNRFVNDQLVEAARAGPCALDPARRGITMRRTASAPAGPPPLLPESTPGTTVPTGPFLSRSGATGRDPDASLGEGRATPSSRSRRVVNSCRGEFSAEEMKPRGRRVHPNG